MELFTQKWKFPAKQRTEEEGGEKKDATQLLWLNPSLILKDVTGKPLKPLIKKKKSSPIHSSFVQRQLRRRFAGKLH